LAAWRLVRRYPVPLYAGKLLDRFQASGNITAGYAVLFSLCGFAYLLAFAVNHALAPRFDRLEIDEDLSPSSAGA